ncbi:hypothetical protein KAFR_0H02950 [Kazachstania africana CBS 2517]|uniref:BHLH domain-containing protein n=1 Tax=Kazachstania africana (strain ATCC 22294 / BCRC 22015 / CBS 2517 / CECT 1963 / NBRC 1671 / NRRL Y-8276) TaxID=1071382 RepID=H2AZE8_KAZAF|nr:hypothetical protein KAFR_0H02950 [Kazachstania africana CBS 2517]CCF59704.1 hypothetical protein KAFR_0H02950 [Kazachstania africana CBS 2517]
MQENTDFNIMCSYIEQSAFEGDGTRQTLLDKDTFNPLEFLLSPLPELTTKSDASQTGTTDLFSDEDTSFVSFGPSNLENSSITPSSLFDGVNTDFSNIYSMQETSSEEFTLDDLTLDELVNSEVEGERVSYQAMISDDKGASTKNTFGGLGKLTKDFEDFCHSMKDIATLNTSLKKNKNIAIPPPGAYLEQPPMALKKRGRKPRNCEQRLKHNLRERNRKRRIANKIAILKEYLPALFDDNFGLMTNFGSTSMSHTEREKQRKRLLSARIAAAKNQFSYLFQHISNKLSQEEVVTRIADHLKDKHNHQ